MNYSFESLRGDLFGGITATVVALPVALAFGVASGLGAAAGLYGAVAVGFFAPMFGGTHSQISGPTAPMTVAMAVIVTNYASTLAEALTVVVMGGLLLVLLGLSRIGRFVAYTPHVVVSGFMSGIGIIVMLMQTLPFFGMPAAPGGAVGAMRAWPELMGDVNTSAFAVAIGLIAADMAHARQLEALELGSVVSVPLLDRMFLFDGGDAAADPYSARAGLVKLKGSFTVASAHKLVTVIGADIKDHEVVIFDFSGATVLDDSAAMVIDRLMDIATVEQTEFIMMGMPHNVREVLQTLGILQKVPAQRLVESLEEARQVANDILHV